jgi:co-chaperonin GroES (HSP10)
MPAMVMQHDVDPKKDLLKRIGDIKDIEIYNNQILVAVYIRPEKTIGGIIIPDENRNEDKTQGKVGLVLKKGPDAFNDESGQWFKDVKVKDNDWVIFRPSDGWTITVNKVVCRILDDVNVRGRIQHPDQVW